MSVDEETGEVTVHKIWAAHDCGRALNPVAVEGQVIGSVWMGLHALREVRRGLLTWEEWLPDGLHPENRGSLVYAHSVTAFLAEALAYLGHPYVGRVL